LTHLTDIKTDVAELKEGQQKLEAKTDKLSVRMENEVIDKVRILFDAFQESQEKIEDISALLVENSQEINRMTES